VHRNLTPQTILVRHDNSPNFTGFDRTKIPSDISVASSSIPASNSPQSMSPEVQTQGLAAAGQRSDVYSLCAWDQPGSHRLRLCIDNRRARFRLI